MNWESLMSESTLSQASSSYYAIYPPSQFLDRCHLNRSHTVLALLQHLLAQGLMSWTVVPPVSSTVSSASDASLTSSKSMETPESNSISTEQEFSLDLVNLVLQDDEESGFCIVNQASKWKLDGIDGMNATGNNFCGTEIETLTDNSPFPLLAAACGAPSLISLDIGLVSPDVSLGESSNGTTDLPAPSFSDEDETDNDTNYFYQLVRDDMVELQFEIDLRLAKFLEMKHMKADGNSLFAAVAAQVYGDSDSFEVTRKNCISFMEYGEILDAQALAFSYSRPVHIYLYSTEHVTVFHPPSAGCSVPIRLSLHYGGHYNWLVELSTELTFGVGLHSSNPANVTRSAEMTFLGAEDSEEGDDDGVMAALLNYVAGNAIRIGGIIKFGAGPDGYYNSCELALALGFTYQEVAVAYRQFGEDGSSMLHHLVMNDTYESRDPFDKNDTAAYAI